MAVQGRYSCLHIRLHTLNKIGECRVSAELNTIMSSLPEYKKGVYQHIMLKEIHEQQTTIAQEMEGLFTDGLVELGPLGLDDILLPAEKIYTIGCGTAYHAGLIGRTLIESLAGVPVESDIASEFAYRHIPWRPNQLMVVISQSGETADTLMALREAKRHGVPVLAITNAPDCTMNREADRFIVIKPGAEKAIASTKAYTSQLAVMYMLALYLANKKGTFDRNKLQAIGGDLLNINQYIARVFTQEEKIMETAWHFRHMENTFFLGRGLDAAVAMEGALKLKETSYIHSEAYATGELKHGPIALIIDDMPVIALVTQEQLADKSIANLHDIRNNGGEIITICTEKLAGLCRDYSNIITIPDVNPLITPLLSVLPLQLFAYYMAVIKGNNVDQPRNLTKSVQVE